MLSFCEDAKTGNVALHIASQNGHLALVRLHPTDCKHRSNGLRVVHLEL